MQFIKTYTRAQSRDEHGGYIYTSCEDLINKDLEEHKNWSIKSFRCEYNTATTTFITVLFEVKEDKKLVE